MSESELRIIKGAVCVLDKPFGWTSFDCVNKIAWTIKQELRLKKKPKVGHAGTLDPYATGVLVIGIGKATKSLHEIEQTDKDYFFEIGFGISSKTFDLDGEVIVDDVVKARKILAVFCEKEKNGAVEAFAHTLLDKFRGEISQVPPQFSAIKIKGKKAYEYAREGKEVKLEPRNVKISRLDLVEAGTRSCVINEVAVEIPFLKLFATVSKGTYIRSLARDIGEVLSVPACLLSLKRLRVGEFNLDHALRLTKETTYAQINAAMNA